ncbi:MAG: D-aminoacylase [Acidobacteriota bacterium]
MSINVTRREFIKSAAAAAVGMSGPGLLRAASGSVKEFDLVIREGAVYDGRGGAGVKADVGIAGDTIRAVGRIPAERAAAVVEAKGLAVCPGFIDLHAHTDIELLVNPKAESSVRQGITTIISGNCGGSGCTVPDAVYEETVATLKEVYGLDLTWRDIKGFLGRLQQSGVAINYSTLVGHGDVRGTVIGYGDRAPTSKELETMAALVRQNLLDGAAGLSSGLEYTPGSFAGSDELVALCRVVAGMGGVYATHMRDEGDQLIEAIDETIGVARQSGVSVQISHLKTAYPRNWSKIDISLARIESAHRDGVKIFCDRYPYIAGATGLSYYFPQWAREGTTEDFIKRLQDRVREAEIREHLAEAEKSLGSWDKVLISDVVTEKNRPIEGKNILEAASAAGKEPYAFMRDLLIEEKGRVGMIIFIANEENLKKILAHPLVSVGTDGTALAPYGPLGQSKPHPRHYGTFPRVLGKYVREEKIVPLETMIRKMTSAAAEKFHFEKRGLVEPGCFADLVVFDPEKVIDRATWVDPHQYPSGIEYVLVNGQVVVERGEHTGRLPGRILRPLAKAAKS